jgi:hypothetical protein
VNRKNSVKEVFLGVAEDRVSSFLGLLLKEKRLAEGSWVRSMV